MVRGHLQTTLTRFCPLSTTYLHLVDILFYCCKVKSLYTLDILNTTYQPCLVNVVKECPLPIKIRKNAQFIFPQTFATLFQHYTATKLIVYNNIFAKGGPLANEIRFTFLSQQLGLPLKYEERIFACFGVFLHPFDALFSALD